MGDLQILVHMPYHHSRSHLPTPASGSIPRRSLYSTHIEPCPISLCCSFAALAELAHARQAA